MGYDNTFVLKVMPRWLFFAIVFVSVHSLGKYGGFDLRLDGSALRFSSSRAHPRRCFAIEQIRNLCEDRE